jgi:hypothetical protein
MFLEHGMMQAAEQEPSKSKRPGNPNWVKGTSQNPAGKEGKAARRVRLEAIVAEWCEPIGGVSNLRSAEYALLIRTAEMMIYRPKQRTAEDEVRVVNTISRVLTQVGLIDKRRKREAAKPPTLAEYLSGRRTGQDAQSDVGSNERASGLPVGSAGPSGGDD